MERADYIAKLKELTGHEDALAVSREINALKSKFDDYVLEEERKLQVSQLEAEEKGEAIPEAEGDYGKEEFNVIFDVYKERRKAVIDERNAMESKNLQEKQRLINRLKEVVTTEENIGAAFASFKEIQEKWKEIGDIPRDRRNDIQREYSKLLEDFFYNITIYKQLKDHDFHRNQQMKLEVIERLKELQKEESIKEVEGQLKQIQNEWEDIGPVPNDQWEAVKEAYWTEVRSLYNRINRFYEDRRSEQRENIEKKKVLVEEARALIVGMAEWDSTKAWDSKTKQILAIQARWKEIGFGPRKENEAVWKEFRGVCDEFFNAKKGFFGKVDSQFDEVAEKKKALIDKANELKTSTDWKNTSNQFIQLQKQWKQLGHAGRRHEQKLWKVFRAACDEFFNSRQQHFENQDKEFEDNLVAKQELLKKIEAYEVPEDKQQALQDLKQFSADFNVIGRVPIKQKNEIYNGFKKAMDEHYGKLKMEGAEKEKVMFLAKIETMKASPDSIRLLRDAKYDLRKQIEREEKEIRQLENNLGFFANSKGAESLKKEVEKKVQRSHDKIKLIREKIKLIPNE